MFDLILCGIVRLNSSIGLCWCVCSVVVICVLVIIGLCVVVVENIMLVLLRWCFSLVRGRVMLLWWLVRFWVWVRVWLVISSWCMCFLLRCCVVSLMVLSVLISSMVEFFSWVNEFCVRCIVVEVIDIGLVLMWVLVWVCLVIEKVCWNRWFRCWLSSL